MRAIVMHRWGVGCVEEMSISCRLARKERCPVLTLTGGREIYGEIWMEIRDFEVEMHDEVEIRREPSDRLHLEVGLV